MRIWGKKGQVSVEYLGILMIFLIILVGVFTTSFNVSSQRQEEIESAQARISVNELVGAVNFLCDRPTGTQKVLLLPFSGKIIAANSSVSGKTIKFVLITNTGTDIIESATDCTVQNESSLPGGSGTYRFNLIKQDTEVNLTIQTGA